MPEPIVLQSVACLLSTQNLAQATRTVKKVRSAFCGVQTEGRPVTVSVGILGTKLGMTQVFDEDGRAIPVTVVQAGPCPVTQIKTKQTDGYTAIQIGYNEVKEKALTKPELGHLAKAGTSPLRHLKEFRVDDPSTYELGQNLTAELFEAGQLVDVIGVSIGKGFAGYQRRHNLVLCPTVLKIIACPVQQEQAPRQAGFIQANAWRVSSGQAK